MLVSKAGNMETDPSAHHFREQLSHAYTFKIVEKNHHVGGTWLENTYPGLTRIEVV